MTANGRDLLDAVTKLPPEELDALIEQAVSLRKASRVRKLSAMETVLIRRINRGLPAKLNERYQRLAARLAKGTITPTEHDELLRLTHEAESCDVDRAAALVELAELRRVPVRVLMNELGIEAAPIHG